MSIADVWARFESIVLDIHYGRIMYTLALFTVRIYNLPECKDEDLPLSVYLLFEEKLNMKVPIETCTRSCKTRKFTGVVFRNIRTRNEVLSQEDVFNDSAIRIERNISLDWMSDIWPNRNAVHWF